MVLFGDGPIEAFDGSLCDVGMQCVNTLLIVAMIDF